MYSQFSFWKDVKPEEKQKNNMYTLGFGFAFTVAAAIFLLLYGDMYSVLAVIFAQLGMFLMLTK